MIRFWLTVCIQHVFKGEWHVYVTVDDANSWADADLLSDAPVIVSNRREAIDLAREIKDILTFSDTNKTLKHRKQAAAYDGKITLTERIA